MNLDAHLRWAQRLLAYFEQGNCRANDTTCRLAWPAWEVLRTQFGAPRVHALRDLAAIRYPRRNALAMALQARSDLALDALDPTFRALADTGRQRLLAAFAWRLPYRRALDEYTQTMEQSKRIRIHLKSQGLHRRSDGPLGPPSDGVGTHRRRRGVGGQATRHVPARQTQKGVDRTRTSDIKTA